MVKTIAKFLRASKMLIAVVMLSVLVTVPLSTHTVFAASQTQEQALCEGSGGTYSGGNCTTPGSKRTVTGTIRQVLNILIFIVGAVSVLMLILGGFRYTVSGGDSSGVKGAKDTIIYAIVGVVVAISSYAIVNFVLTNIGA